MISKNRLILAYLLAPLIPTIIVVLLDEIFRHDKAGSATLLIALFSLPLSYLACLLGGSLLVYILNKMKALCLGYMLLGGFILGAVAWYFIGYLIAFLLESDRDLVPALLDIIGGGLLGVSVALPFGIIAGIPWRTRHL